MFSMSRGPAFLGAVLGIWLTAAQGASAATLPTFVIKGHGWGHGVGMAQDGAYGYAKHGFGYAKILSHYYPGTALGKTTVPQVPRPPRLGREQRGDYVEGTFPRA